MGNILRNILRNVGFKPYITENATSKHHDI